MPDDIRIDLIEKDIFDDVDMDVVDDELDVDAIFNDANRRIEKSFCNHFVVQDPAKLREFLADFNKEVPKFKEGEFLTWKNVMRNRALPDEGQPCIFMRYVPYEESLISPDGHLTLMDCVDMEVAAFDPDGDILIFMADSRRMRRWDGDV